MKSFIVGITSSSFMTLSSATEISGKLHRAPVGVHSSKENATPNVDEQKLLLDDENLEKGCFHDKECSDNEVCNREENAVQRVCVKPKPEPENQHPLDDVLLLLDDDDILEPEMICAGDYEQNKQEKLEISFTQTKSTKYIQICQLECSISKLCKGFTFNPRFKPGHHDSCKHFIFELVKDGGELLDSENLGYVCLKTGQKALETKKAQEKLANAYAYAEAGDGIPGAEKDLEAAIESLKGLQIQQKESDDSRDEWFDAEDGESEDAKNPATN